MEDGIASSQDKEVANLFNKSSSQKSSLGADSRQLPDSSPELTSDNSSCAIVDGEITQMSKSIMEQLELDEWNSTDSIKKNNSNVTNEATSLGNVLKSIENRTGHSELQDSTKTSNTSNGTTSLLSHNYALKVGMINNNSKKSKRQSKNATENSDMEITSNLTGMLAVVAENKETSSATTTDCEKMSLRLSCSSNENNQTKNYTTENTKENEISYLADNRQKRKGNSNSLLPSKQLKINTTTFLTTKAIIPEKKVYSGRKRLYDPDANLDGSILSYLTQKNDTDANKTILKKPAVLLTPVLVTQKAKELLDKKNTKKVESKQKAVSCRRESVTASVSKIASSVNNRKSVGSLQVKRKKEKDPVKNKDKLAVSLDKFKTPDSVSSRRSVRILQLSAKTQNNSTSSNIDSNSAFENVSITPIKRRSTLEFAVTSSIKKKEAKKNSMLRGIVCTRLHKPDVEVFMQIVKKLGEFVVENEVTANTTHLVAGEPRRTINLLRAIGRGCWIVKHEWVSIIFI